LTRDYNNVILNPEVAEPSAIFLCSLTDKQTEGGKMEGFLAGYSNLEQVLIYIAIFTGIIFVLQNISTLLGIGDDDGDGDFDGDGDGDGDVDGDGEEGEQTLFGNIITIRNGVAFLLGFSLGTLMALQWGLWTFIAVFLGLAAGSGLVTVNLMLLFAISKISHKGNVNLNHSIGSRAEVMLSVPSNRSGTGKVSVSFNGRLMELHAITDDEQLPKGSHVDIINIEGSTAVVAK
jgi:membrane protein implicated in regulation of membrane protease activity